MKLVWSLVLCGLTCTLTAADQTKYYDITGSSAAELRESLNRQRPRAPDGTRPDAFTVGKIRWKFTTARARAECAISSFGVTLDVVMTLPRWVNEAGASPALVDRWRKYSAALLTHENGHKDFAAAAADEIRLALAAVSPQATCAELARVVDAVGTSLLDQYRERERRYDRETDHGRTQGARFP